jgi:S1-C subfamily serine protease
MNVAGPTGQGAGRDITVQGATLRCLQPGRGLFGDHGVPVVAVAVNSPAAAGGLKAGDVLLKVDGRPVRTPQEVAAILAGMSPGRSVRLGVLREGEARGMDLPVGATAAAFGLPGSAFGLPVAAPGIAAAPMAQGPVAAPGWGAPGATAAPARPLVPTEFNWLGLEIEAFQPVTPVAGTPPGMVVKGAVIAEVLPGSRAALAGLRANDVILEVNNQAVPGAAQFDAAIKSVPTNQPSAVLIKANRNGQEFLIAM